MSDKYTLYLQSLNYHQSLAWYFVSKSKFLHIWQDRGFGLDVICIRSAFNDNEDRLRRPSQQELLPSYMYYWNYVHIPRRSVVSRCKDKFPSSNRHEFRCFPHDNLKLVPKTTKLSLIPYSTLFHQPKTVIPSFHK